MNVFLDDVRNPARCIEGYGYSDWVWVRTAEEAIELLRSGKVKAISLDHDLGIGQKTGYDVLLWMEEHDVWPETIRIHSMNAVGRQRMLAVLEARQRRQASGAESRTGG